MTPNEVCLLIVMPVCNPILVSVDWTQWFASNEQNNGQSDGMSLMRSGYKGLWHPSHETVCSAFSAGMLWRHYHVEWFHVERNWRQLLALISEGGTKACSPKTHKKLNPTNDQPREWAQTQILPPWTLRWPQPQTTPWPQLYERPRWTDSHKS